MVNISESPLGLPDQIPSLHTHQFIAWVSFSTEGMSLDAGNGWPISLGQSVLSVLMELEDDAIPGFALSLICVGIYACYDDTFLLLRQNSLSTSNPLSDMAHIMEPVQSCYSIPYTTVSLL